MIEIVLSVCLADDGRRCKKVSLSYLAEGVSPYQCMLFGQSEIAKWTEAHPKWSVRRWTCGAAREIAKI